METGHFQSKDGTKLFFRCMPNAEATASLLFVHGYGEHSGRYEHIMKWFHGKGFDVAAFDYRGHGHAEGQRGHVTRYSEYSEDVDAFIRLVQSRSDKDRKIYLVGHSNGGLIVANYVLEQPEGIDGVVLSAPLMGFKIKIPAWKNALGKGMSKIWPTLSMPSEVPSKHLTHDIAIAEAYDNDELVHKAATSRWFTEANDTQSNALKQAHRIHLPLLLMQGGDDLIVDPDASRNFLNTVGSSDKEILWYDGLYHEIFNEPSKEELYADLHQWLLQH